MLGLIIAFAMGINLSSNILKFLNSINNKKDEYYFLNTDNSNKLNKYINKNLLKIKFDDLEKK